MKELNIKYLNFSLRGGNKMTSQIDIRLDMSFIDIWHIDCFVL